MFCFAKFILSNARNESNKLWEKNPIYSNRVDVAWTHTRPSDMWSLD